MPTEIKLHLLPSVVLSIAEAKGDQAKIIFKLSEDTRAYTMTALMPSNHCFTGMYDEADLLKVLNAADALLDWEDFAKAMDSAFSRIQVSVSEGASSLTLQLKVGNGTASFTLNPVTESTSVIQFIESVYDLHTLRIDEKTRDNAMKDSQKKNTDAQAKEQKLIETKEATQKQIVASQEEEKLCMEEYQRLFKELQESQQKQKKDKMEDLFVPADPELTKTVGRRPLLEDARPYDTLVLRLIKSKYISSSDDPSDDLKNGKVIRPFSKNEFEIQLRNLPDDHRKLVFKCFDKLDAWDFDVFSIQDFTDGGSLFYTAYALFAKHDFIRKFNLDEQILINFLSQVEAGYHPNPYHNSMHAADVLHVLHYILVNGGLHKLAHLTTEDLFASLIAGMIHDYDHPGINNNFHIKVQSYLATLYNDKSILENHHCAEVFDLMKNPSFNIFGAFPEDQRRDMRETVIDMVLATDMGLHAKILGTWKRRIQQDMDLHNKKEDQRLALSMAIKMADISNCGRPEGLYLRWAYKINEEFFLQGDRERNLGSAVSPFMDRNVPSMAKGQIAFMNFIVIPLFETISEYISDMHFTVDHCEQNKNYWAANDDTVV